MGVQHSFENKIKPLLSNSIGFTKGSISKGKQTLCQDTRVLSPFLKMV